ncbi:MAG: spondin domain-containing protein, partial [Pseudomonadota bacterium]|nr:spondin domain-containing protein [Pseudomonadota bacterium]
MKSKLIGLGLVSMVGAASVSAAELEVTVTNVTRGTIFTPILVVSHSSGLDLFEPGQPAGDELSALAEGGDTGSLADKLAEDSRFVDSASSEGLLH